MSIDVSNPAARSWPAFLKLKTVERQGQTRLTLAEHQGPLRVQRPFAQADGSCHIYVLHPPGGLVGGDSLDVQITAEENTHAVYTTPAAGKHYRCLPAMAAQVNRQTITLAERALVEWLPQETIFFKSSRASLLQVVNLQESSAYLGWEMIALGRRASGEDFSEGELTQTSLINIAGRLVHREQLHLGQNLQNEPWGLAGKSMFGTLIAVSSLPDEAAMRALVAGLQHEFNAQEWGVTLKSRTLIVRYIGDSPEQCREGFFAIRDRLHAANFLRTEGLGERPRIWKT